MRASGVRQRLAPQERMTQILQAAQREFARHGFQQTRVEDIARAAGLSKGGFYAHFSGKESVFEALLQRSLSSSTVQFGELFRELPPMPVLIDHLSDVLTRGLASEEVMVVFRILLADGWRVPDVVQSWREHNIQNIQHELCTLLQRCVAAGLCRNSVVVQNPWLVLSPVVHAMVAQLISTGQPEFDRQRVRQDLACLLRELLIS